MNWIPVVDDQSHARVKNAPYVLDRCQIAGLLGLTSTAYSLFDQAISWSNRSTSTAKSVLASRA